MKPLVQDLILLWFQQVGGAAPAPGVDIPSGAFVAKITNDAREDEMEENMEQVYFIYQIEPKAVRRGAKEKSEKPSWLSCARGRCKKRASIKNNRLSNKAKFLLQICKNNQCKAVTYPWKKKQKFRYQAFS